MTTLHGDRAAPRALLAALSIGALLGSSTAIRSQENPADHEFRYARLAFGAYGGRFGGGRGEPWLRDWPEADYHFLEGLRRLTRVDAAPSSAQVRIDEEIFDYPLVYAVKVGFMRLDSREAGLLREYLLRGGFLIVDDFHGPQEWEEFAASMRRVFPDRQIVELTDDAEVFHVLYNVDQRVQIPGRQAVASGVTWEHPQGVPARWRGIRDDAGRLMVAINFNMDLGDAWEHADDAFYPEPLTALAYRFGVNYVVYSMTH